MGEENYGILLDGLSECERPFEQSRHRLGVRIQMDYTEGYWNKWTQNGGN